MGGSAELAPEGSGGMGAGGPAGGPPGALVGGREGSNWQGGFVSEGREVS
jgi:hypothetical protein